MEHSKTSIPSVPILVAALDSEPRFTVIELNRVIIERSASLYAVGEMHDRQIVATALSLIERGEAIPLVTHDSNITASGLVPVSW